MVRIDLPERQEFVQIVSSNTDLFNEMKNNIISSHRSSIQSADDIYNKYIMYNNQNYGNRITPSLTLFNQHMESVNTIPEVTPAEVIENINEQSVNNQINNNQNEQIVNNVNSNIPMMANFDPNDIGVWRNEQIPNRFIELGEKEQFVDLLNNSPELKESVINNLPRNRQNYYRNEGSIDELYGWLTHDTNKWDNRAYVLNATNAYKGYLIDNSIQHTINLPQAINREVTEAQQHQEAFQQIEARNEQYQQEQEARHDLPDYDPNNDPLQQAVVAGQQLQEAIQDANNATTQEEFGQAIEQVNQAQVNYDNIAQEATDQGVPIVRNEGPAPATDFSPLAQTAEEANQDSNRNYSVVDIGHATQESARQEASRQIEMQRAAQEAAIETLSQTDPNIIVTADPSRLGYVRVNGVATTIEAAPNLIQHQINMANQDVISDEGGVRVIRDEGLEQVQEAYNEVRNGVQIANTTDNDEVFRDTINNIQNSINERNEELGTQIEQYSQNLQNYQQELQNYQNIEEPSKEVTQTIKNRAKEIKDKYNELNAKMIALKQLDFVKNQQQDYYTQRKEGRSFYENLGHNVGTWGKSTGKGILKVGYSLTEPLLRMNPDSRWHYLDTNTGTIYANPLSWQSQVDAGKNIMESFSDKDFRRGALAIGTVGTLGLGATTSVPIVSKGLTAAGLYGSSVMADKALVDSISPEQLIKLNKYNPVHWVGKGGLRTKQFLDEDVGRFSDYAKQQGGVGYMIGTVGDFGSSMGKMAIDNPVSFGLGQAAFGKGIQAGGEGIRLITPALKMGEKSSNIAASIFEKAVDVGADLPEIYSVTPPNMWGPATAAAFAADYLFDVGVDGSLAVKNKVTGIKTNYADFQNDMKKISDINKKLKQTPGLIISPGTALQKDVKRLSDKYPSLMFKGTRPTGLHVASSEHNIGGQVFGGQQAVLTTESQLVPYDQLNQGQPLLMTGQVDTQIARIPNQYQEGPVDYTRPNMQTDNLLDLQSSDNPILGNINVEDGNNYIGSYNSDNQDITISPINYDIYDGTGSYSPGGVYYHEFAHMVDNPVNRVFTSDNFNKEHLLDVYRTLARSRSSNDNEYREYIGQLMDHLEGYPNEKHNREIVAQIAGNFPDEIISPTTDIGRHLYGINAVNIDSNLGVYRYQNSPDFRESMYNNINENENQIAINDGGNYTYGRNYSLSTNNLPDKVDFSKEVKVPVTAESVLTLGQEGFRSIEDDGYISMGETRQVGDNSLMRDVFISGNGRQFKVPIMVNKVGHFTFNEYLPEFNMEDLKQIGYNPVKHEVWLRDRLGNNKDVLKLLPEAQRKQLLQEKPSNSIVKVPDFIDKGYNAEIMTGQYGEPKFMKITGPDGKPIATMSFSKKNPVFILNEVAQPSIKDKIKKVFNNKNIKPFRNTDQDLEQEHGQPTEQGLVQETQQEQDVSQQQQQEQEVSSQQQSQEVASQQQSQQQSNQQQNTYTQQQYSQSQNTSQSQSQSQQQQTQTVVETQSQQNGDNTVTNVDLEQDEEEVQDINNIQDTRQDTRQDSDTLQDSMTDSIQDSAVIQDSDTLQDVAQAIDVAEDQALDTSLDQEQELDVVQDIETPQTPETPTMTTVQMPISTENTNKIRRNRNDDDSNTGSYRPVLIHEGQEFPLSSYISYKDALTVGSEITDKAENIKFKIQKSNTPRSKAKKAHERIINPYIKFRKINNNYIERKQFQNDREKSSGFNIMKLWSLKSD